MNEKRNKSTKGSSRGGHNERARTNGVHMGRRRYLPIRLTNRGIPGPPASEGDGKFLCRSGYKIARLPVFRMCIASV